MVGVVEVGKTTMHIIQDYLSFPVNYINCIFNLLCRFYLANRAKLFVYAKGPHPDQWETEAPPMITN